ncbi:tRNA dimethylallyltransferase [Anaerospora hongkongensis]|uniref:tRNA dimethylallyltransferase n=1 Tax=Anaerospora hongkongensis TaxID=244830 RepID=A0A4R1PWJ2_9FIRM|nr:tRNA (adenosine(37)-N6)-dimethylallyltransferase MiaA [Anaerospora hongkongensis]TCL35915.1 tRNA dimethylallyltransferase [Anaerospora hongkongensis]
MERLIVIVGPTAVGKTQVSIDLAKKLNTEIISGDSMLVYRSLNIGTAKPTPAEQQGIPHHLIDILEATEPFSVVDFQQQAGQLIHSINSQDRIPILAGGTGLYVKSLLEGYCFNSTAGDEAIRQKLENIVKEHDHYYLHNMLAQVSPEKAAKLHPHDVRRVIRALEVYEVEGKTVSETTSVGQGNLLYDAVVIGLTMQRPLLYERINKRVDIMIAQGLIEEVQRLLDQGVSPGSQAMQGIGYKEVIQYLQGECDLPTTIENIKKATRHFAKRQLTWYRRMPYIKWVEADSFPEYNKMLAYIYSLIAGRF